MRTAHGGQTHTLSESSVTRCHVGDRMLDLDRLSDVLGSRTVRVREEHPILHRIVGQAKVCNLSMRGSKQCNT
jgi:hypothetical protein